MRSVPKPDQLKSALKSLLKEKKLQYSDLASRLGCSIPTIKRILGPEELTLSRLLDICDVLEINLGELEAIIAAGALADQSEFNEEQDVFLAKNTNYLAYLAALYSGMTPEEVATKHKLTKRSTDLYLVRLEKLGLIRVGVRGRVRLANKDFPRFRKNGELAKTNLRAILEKTVGVIHRQIGKHAKSQQPLAGAGIDVRGHRVSVEIYNQWAARIREVAREIRAQAEFEEKYRKKPGSPMAIISFMHVLVDHDDPDVKAMDSALGEITNL